MRRRKGKGRKAVCLILILAGAGIFLYPDIATWLQDRETAALVEEFETEYPAGDGSAGSAAQDSAEGSADGAGETDASLDALYESALAYNAAIYADGQAGFRDAFSYEQEPASLDGWDGGIFGYISIPAMDTELPLYLGASTEHLARGAAVLGETSLPVGGENTNCVIAGHRGYRGVPFFRYIENLTEGDLVYITNPWETLTYRVESVAVISPYDTDAVKIQEGRDMVTLLTCHPYRGNGEYRYVVCCVRDDGTGDAGDGTAADTSGSGTADIPDASADDILMEDLLRRGLGAALLCILAVTLAASALRRRRDRRRRGTCF